MGHEAGPWRASFVPTDWVVRVFGKSILVDRPSARLYVQTMPLSG